MRGVTNRVLVLGFVGGGILASAAAGVRAQVQERPAVEADELEEAVRWLDQLLEAPPPGDRRGRRERSRRLQSLRRLVPRLPADDATLLPRIRELRERHSLRPSPTEPARDLSAAHLLGAMLELDEVSRFAPEEVTAHPTAASFPGLVPASAPRVSRPARVVHRRGVWRSQGIYAAAGRPTWHGTGLYAPAGEVITVQIPAALASAGLRIRTGCHSDVLWGKSTWRRMPQITHSWPLESSTTRVASPFGGLLYVEVPHEFEGDEFLVQIGGVVEAPTFVLGATDPLEWRARIRHHPAPWAELATDRLVLSVPSTAVRELDDPREVLELWNRVLDAQADLAGWPRERFRPERFVTDADISVGYMHSGYPLMAQLDVADVVVSTARLRENLHGGIWGLYHEIGHNHQSSDWTFGGTTEVTVNLFTMYTYHQVFENPTPRESLHGEGRAQAIARYREGGAEFQQWQADPFLALVMYLQVQEAFGWAALREVFAEYRTLAPEERPRSDDDKRDQWLIRLSRQVGHDLGPFFETWGVPVSAAARAEVADLPDWMPAELAGS